MKTRIITAIIGFAILLTVLIIGGLSLLFVVWGATLLALYEYFHAIETSGKHPIKFVGYYSTVMFPLFGISAFFPEFFNANRSLILGVILLMFLFGIYTMYGLCVLKHKHYNFDDVAQTLFSILYICVPLFLILPIYFGLHGKILIWILFIIAWGTDICAYFIGVFFGKHKIMPELSPKKTFEGFFGGLVGSTILMTIYGLLVANIFNTFDWWVYALLGFMLSLVSQFGDWFASSIKRHANIKDFGNILPGHGGFIDRCDSIIFIIPMVYIFTIFING